MTQSDFLQYGAEPTVEILLTRLQRTVKITQAIMRSLSAGQEMVSVSENLNPPYWEFGHLIWFHEFWVHRMGIVSSPSFLDEADTLFNSSELAHDDRWKVTLPSIHRLYDYLECVMYKTYAILRSGSISRDQAYFIQLALFHQDMHNEAFAYMWQSLAYAWPIAKDEEVPLSKELFSKSQYIHIPAGEFLLGSPRNSGFIFDNEKWQHSVHMPSFSVTSHAVSNADYLKYIESHDPARDGCHLTVPRHWKKEGNTWYERSFDRWLPMEMQEPVRHISGEDAALYCRRLGVRLPNEAELTVLLQSSPPAWRSSGLWEWTSSTFEAFTGFSADSYHDYSAPWFDGKHRVLKGWSRYTPEYLRRSQFRNFYLPSRNDPFCGFRTCLA